MGDWLWERVKSNQDLRFAGNYRVLFGNSDGLRQKTGHDKGRAVGYNL